jgi:hypothetical protein
MKLYHSRKDSYAGTHTHTYIHFYIDNHYHYCQNSPFGARALEDSVGLHPVFILLDFAILFFYAEQGHQPCGPAGTKWEQISVALSSSDRMAHCRH